MVVPEAADPPKEIRSWDDVNSDSAELIGIIRADYETTRQKYNGVVVMPKGGYHTGSLLPEALGFDNDQIMHACIQSYDPEKKERTGKYIIGEMPPRRLVRDTHLLVTDEVWDTGNTLFLTKWYLRILGAATVKVAVLDFKEGKNEVNDRPDFFVNKTDAWIDYPWEREREATRSGVNVVERLRKPKIVEPREWLAELALKYGFDPNLIPAKNR